MVTRQPDGSGRPGGQGWVGEDSAIRALDAANPGNPERGVRPFQRKSGSCRASRTYTDHSCALITPWRHGAIL
jgi:hypothetical protein